MMMPADLRTSEGPSSFEEAAGHMLRLAMVLVFLSFGAHKFTAYEAEGIAPLVSNSPLTSWLNALGTQGASVSLLLLAQGLALRRSGLERSRSRSA